MKWIEKYRDKIMTLILTGGMLLLQPRAAFAAGIADSKFITGTLQLLNDGASGLTKLAIAAAVVAIIAFALLKIFADDMENKMWDKRLIRAIVGCIIVLTASLLVDMFTGYYL